MDSNRDPTNSVHLPFEPGGSSKIVYRTTVVPGSYTINSPRVQPVSDHIEGPIGDTSNISEESHLTKGYQ